MRNLPELGYDAGMGYELEAFDDAELEKTYAAVVAETGYDPEQAAKQVFAAFALPPEPAAGPRSHPIAPHLRPSGHNRAPRGRAK